MTTTSGPRTAATDLGLLLLTVIWGVNFSVVKVALAEVPPLAFNALRFPLAVAALALLLRHRPGVRRPDPEDVARIVGLGLVGHVAYQLGFIYGLDWTRAGNASLLLATTPIWTVVLSALAGHERPTGRMLAGVSGTLAGMVLVVLGGEAEVSLASETLRGDLLMVGSSMMWSLYTVAGRTPVAKYGALRMTAWTLYAGVPVLVLLGIPSLSRTDLLALTPGAWLAVVYAGVFAIGVAYVLWYHGVRRLGNNRTAIYSNLVPLTAVATAWI